MKSLLLIATLAATSAAGATLHEYIPGGSPCNGACEQSWAQELANVPDGELRPLIVPKGSLVHFMTYARDGVPHHEYPSSYLGQDEPAIGYYFERDGRTYLFAKLHVCDNWAVFSSQPVIAEGSWASTLPPVSVTALPLTAVNWVPRPYGRPAYDPPDHEIPTTPLPAGFWFLLAAISGLFVATKRLAHWTEKL